VIRAPAAARGPSSSCGRRTATGQPYNLVGFQTRLAYPEQKRIFRMIPALAAAELISGSPVSSRGLAFPKGRAAPPRRGELDGVPSPAPPPVPVRRWGMAIRQVILDFDGTCTRVEEVERSFLTRYRELVAAEWSAAAAESWEAHERMVREASPVAGWMLGGAPSAPAAADPYILSGEVVALLARRKVAAAPPSDRPSAWYRAAYAAHPAPWRPETAEVIASLVADGRRVAFVSNSDPDKVGERIDELGLGAALRRRIQVHGHASKFRIQEPRFEAAPPPPLAARFAALPAAADSSLMRPLYLRRGAYFETLCAVWTAEQTTPEETLVVGDVWELDLAMPAALGCRVHLIRRLPPYATYAYELEAAARMGDAAAVADDLAGVVARARQG
jgi:FMN phosphatase YigB (HAD superfamily)